MPTLVDELARLIVGDNAILLVGSALGQGGDRLPIVEQIAQALAERIHYDRPLQGLPAVARDFEVLRGRHALVLALREELEKAGAHESSAIYELIADAVIPGTKIITTRFDGVLEHALEQLAKSFVLIVRETDLPFFDESKVTLIKMQGDINQPDSLIITEDDVDAFIDRLPTVSDVVRAFFATKTLIFIGYDLQGAQFKRMFGQVTRNLTVYRRQAYAIVPQPLDVVEKQYWRGQQVEIHVEDPLLFLEELAQAVREAAQEPAPVGSPSAGMDDLALPEQPYKGLYAFTAADRGIFFGRGEEARQLSQRILAHRTVVLYGESGSGKTSLLQAGVGPLLGRSKALLVSCAPATGEPLASRIEQVLLERRDALLAAGRLAPAIDHRDVSLPAVPAIIQEWQQILGGPVVLAVDQFEDLFMAHDEPARVEALRFLHELVIDRRLDVRLVLVIREDWLGRLQKLEQVFPRLLDVRFRLQQLGREEARAAVEEPARLYGVSWHEPAVEKLLDELYDESAISGYGMVAPPQLQIVCGELWGAAAERGQRLIGQDLIDELGGTGAILGHYLDRALDQFDAAQQPLVRDLLGALVGSEGSRQRLPADDLARVVEADGVDWAQVRALVTPILDELVELRLVRRYQTEPAAADGQDEQYELAHSYLAAHIGRWLGADYWAAQEAREILRHARAAWEERGRLLAHDDLRLIRAHVPQSMRQGHFRLAPSEAELIYASAIAYEGEGAACPVPLDGVECRRVLLRLVSHPDAPVRARAVEALVAFPGDGIPEALARAVLEDGDEDVQLAGARAIAGLWTSDTVRARQAVTKLVEQAREAQGGSERPARRALCVIRDLEPSVESELPSDLRRLVRHCVWTARWRRARPQILSRTLQGLQGGFWGLGLGMGLFLGLNDVAASGVDRIPWRTAVQLMSLGFPLAGLIGALVGGSSGFAGSVLHALADRERRWLRWAIINLTGATAMGLGLMLLAYVSAGTPRPLRSLAAGALVGLVLTGVAVLPVRWPAVLRWALGIVSGMGIFLLVWWLGLLFGRLGWLLLMGGAAGLGMALGLGPVRPGASTGSGANVEPIGREGDAP